MRKGQSYYDSEGAAKAVAADYRSGITAADSVDLTDPLSGVALLPTFGRQSIAVSLRFTGPGDSCDLYVVNWAEDNNGTKIALGSQVIASVSPKGLREAAAGKYLGDTQFLDVSGAQFFEVRLLGVTSAGIDIRTWTF